MKPEDVLRLVYDNHKKKYGDDHEEVQAIDNGIAAIQGFVSCYNPESMEKAKESIPVLKRMKDQCEQNALRERREMLDVGFLSVGNNSPQEQMARAFETALRKLNEEIR